MMESWELSHYYVKAIVKFRSRRNSPNLQALTVNTIYELQTSNEKLHLDKHHTAYYELGMINS